MFGLLLVLLPWFGMLSCLKGYIIFQCTDEMTTNVFTSLVIRCCGIDSPEYFTGRCLSDNRRHRLLLQKVLGETLPAFPSLDDLIICLVLCVVDTAIRVVLSAGPQNMQTVGSTCCTCKLFNAVHPVIYFVCDPAVSFHDFA